jgi:hypothetical protein
MNDQERVRKLPLYENLIDAAREWIPGEVHSHREISDILGVEIQSAHFYYHAKMATKKLRNYQIHLRNRLGVGYYINPPDETLDLIGNKVDAIQRRAEDTHDIIETTPLHKLSPHEVQNIRNVGDRVMGMVILAKQTRQSIAQLSEIKPTIQLNASREKNHLVGEVDGNENSQCNA